MSVRVDGDIIHLAGDCMVEDAEILSAALEGFAGRRVDVSQCRHLHGAMVQALLAFRPEMVGEPLDDFVKAFVMPAFTNSRALTEQALRRDAVSNQE